MADPRAADIYQIPAVELRPGDLVDTSAKHNEWQQVIGVFRAPADVPAAEDAKGLADLVEAAAGRYVVVQLTDIAPVDAGVFFDDDGVALAAGEDDEDVPASEVMSSEDGVRTYVYTKFELVTVRATS